VPVLKLFLSTYEQTKDKQFGLLPELGIHTRALVNPSMRKSCFGGKLPDHRVGCLVTYIRKHSCAAEQIEVGDILIKIDGVKVSEKEDVMFRGQERLPWEYLITRKAVGERVEITLKPLPRLVPRIFAVDYIPTYVIIGGLLTLPAGESLSQAALDRSQQGEWSSLTWNSKSVSFQGSFRMRSTCPMMSLSGRL